MLLFLVTGYLVAFASEYCSIRNGFPYGFYTPDSERGRELLADAAQDGSRLPVALLTAAAE